MKACLRIYLVLLSVLVLGGCESLWKGNSKSDFTGFTKQEGEIVDSQFGGSAEPTSRKLASATDETPRNIVIAIHGIGGDKSTFGAMKDVLPHHLNQIVPNYKNEFYTFVYKKNGESQDTFDYAEKDLSAFIKTEIFHNKLPNADDRISFVCHSQGGLIAMIWYVGTIIAEKENSPGFRNRQLSDFAPYARQVKSILTLGTPFWGSKIATRSIDITKFDPTRDFFNKNEMKEVAFGSNTIYGFRRTSIAIGSQKDLKNLFTAKIVNISGIYPDSDKKLYVDGAETQGKMYKLVRGAFEFIKDKFDYFAFGQAKESDIAVLVPSSQFRFMYNQDLNPPSASRNIRGEDYKEVNYQGESQSIIVEAIHAVFTPKVTKGIAYIPESCMEIEKCDHSTYYYLLKELSKEGANGPRRALREKVLGELANKLPDRPDESVKIKNSLEGFTVEVVLRFPDEKYDLEDPKFKSKPGVKFYSLYRPGSPEDTKDDLWLLNQKQFFKEVLDLPQFNNGKFLSDDGNFEIFFGDSDEYLSKYARIEKISFRESEHKDLRLHFTGYVKLTEKGKRELVSQEAKIQEIKKQGFDIRLQLNLPGLQSEDLVVRVKTGYSSFLEVQTGYR